MAARSVALDIPSAAPVAEGWTLVRQAARAVGRCAFDGRVSFRRHATDNSMVLCLMESGPNIAITGQMLVFGTLGVLAFLLFYRQFDWNS